MLQMKTINDADIASTGFANERPELVDAPVAVSVRNVVKSYGSVTAVDGISLTIKQGEFLTLLGPSGCGKTTLLNMIAGFFHPTSGQIVIYDKDVTQQPPYLRDTGMVFQNYALFPHMTVAQNIAFGLEERRMAKSEVRPRVERALDMVKLAGFGDRLPLALSGGQQQRVALARALVIEPQVLLLDEPLSALDKNLRTQMQIEIKQLQMKANVATVFVTHDQSEALALSDRIAVLNKGTIEQIGTPQDIYTNPRTSFVASFIGEVNKIPGTVIENGAQHIALTIAGGRTLTVPKGDKGGFIPGSDVNLFIRPEDLTLAPASQQGPDVLAARITAQSYQGSFFHVIAEVAGVGDMMIAAPLGPNVPATIGAPVSLKIDMHKAMVLPV